MWRESEKGKNMDIAEDVWGHNSRTWILLLYQ